MYKKLIDKTDSSYKSDYEYFTLKKPVKQIDGELYTTLEGAEKGFNFVASYNSSNNTIKIYTYFIYDHLPYFYLLIYLPSRYSYHQPYLSDCAPESLPYSSL